MSTVTRLCKQLADKYRVPSYAVDLVMVIYEWVSQETIGTSELQSGIHAEMICGTCLHMSTHML